MFNTALCEKEAAGERQRFRLGLLSNTMKINCYKTDRNKKDK